MTGVQTCALPISEETGEWLNALTGVPPNILTWLQTVYLAGKNSLLTVGGTVKLTIIDSTFSVPSDTLVDTVQTAIDPTQNAGEGVGIAPIGHVVKVFPVAQETLDLAFDLSYQNDWDWEAVEPYVMEVINSYFKELAKTWADQEEPLMVRVSQLESRILNVTGIVDITNTAINAKTANHSLPLDHIPVLGTVTVQG